MEGFEFVHREPVRFRDIDALGHVNHAVFLTYCESARVAFLEQVGATRGLDELPIILARAEIDFRSPVRLGEVVDVGVRASRFGAKSFDLEYELRVGDRLVAQAKTVQVAFDYERREAIELPQDWRERLAVAV